MPWAKVPGTNTEQFTDAAGNVIATQELDGKATAAPPTGAPTAGTTPAVAPGAPASLTGIGSVASPDAAAAPPAPGMGSLGGILAETQAGNPLQPIQGGGGFGQLRPLSQRAKPQESMALAGLGRRVF